MPDVIRFSLNTKSKTRAYFPSFLAASALIWIPRSQIHQEPSRQPTFTENFTLKNGMRTALTGHQGMGSPASSVCLANMEQEEVEVRGFIFVLNSPSASQGAALMDSERKLRSTLCLDELVGKYLTGALWKLLSCNNNIKLLLNVFSGAVINHIAIQPNSVCLNKDLLRSHYSSINLKGSAAENRKLETESRVWMMSKLCHIHSLVWARGDRGLARNIWAP